MTRLISERKGWIVTILCWRRGVGGEGGFLEIALQGRGNGKKKKKR